MTPSPPTLQLQPKRVLVVGAGAIGGLLAARLALAGHDVSVVARGAHCAAMRERGHLLLETRAGTQRAHVTAWETLAAAPAAEVVFVTLKAYQLPALAEDLAAKAHAAKLFVPIQNGIPWWYFQRAGGVNEGRSVHAVDPEGKLARRRTGVAHLALTSGAPVVPGFATVAAEVIAPGHVLHPAFDEDAIPVGPLAAEDRHLAEAAAAVVSSTGFHAPLVDVRQFAWVKLLGNIWTNPLGALGRATVAHVATVPASRKLALALMKEAESVARALGVEPGLDFEKRLERARRLRQGVKSSMLQDIERGRATERQAIVTAVVELAALAGIEVPRIATLDVCMELLEESVLTARALELESTESSIPPVPF